MFTDEGQYFGLLACDGGSVESVSTYADLSTLTPSDGHLVLVESGDGAGLWQYSAIVDGFSTGWWLPADLTFPGIEYVEVVGSYPLRYSGGNSEVLATLAARGWVNNSAGGTVSDGGGFLRFQSSGPWGIARLDVNIPAAEANGRVLIVAEVKTIGPASGTSNHGYVFIDGYRGLGVTYGYNGVPDQQGFYNIAAAPGFIAASSTAIRPSFARTLCVCPTGPSPASIETLPLLWEAGKHRAWNQTYVERSSLYATSSLQQTLLDQAPSGTSETQVAEYHVFKLAA